MLRSLYTAYTGMINEQRRMDIMTNNLANATTAGFKMESSSSQSFDKVLGIKIRDVSEAFNDHSIGQMSLGVKVGEVFTDYSQGALRETSGKYDLALSGEGFFAVRFVDKNGNESTKYTRDGNFRLTKDGHVTDVYGNQLRTESGVLQVPLDSEDISIGVDGTVTVNKQVIDKIKIVDFEDYDYIEKFGDNLYQTVDGATEKKPEAQVLQGYIEQSNVNSVREMVNLITITRAYEAGQKMIQSSDRVLESAVNSVGNYA